MLEKILEYQDIDMKYNLVKNELNNSKDREIASNLGNRLKEQHAKLIKLEEDAKKINLLYKEANDKYELYLNKLSELEKEMENADSSKFSIYEKAYKDFSNISNSLEKQISNIYNEFQKINREYESILSKSKEDRAKFDKHKSIFSKLKSEKEPIINDLEKKLKEKEKQVDKKLFEKYLAKKENKISMPIFARLNDNKCGGCRMVISASKIQEINKNEFGVIECENCGRYIYIEK